MELSGYGDRRPWLADSAERPGKDFGTEAWLVELAYASAASKVAPMARPTPPTVNGSGFIDEMGWLFVLPPTAPDVWGVNWQAYRDNAAEKQISFYSKTDPTACLAQIRVFGLSAGEMPD